MADINQENLGQENVEYAIHKAQQTYREKNQLLDALFWGKVIEDLVRKYGLIEKYNKALAEQIKRYEGKKGKVEK